MSEFFVLRLTFTSRPLKKPIHLRLPVLDEPNVNSELCVKERGLDEQEWTEAEFTTTVSGPVLNCV